MNLSLMFILVVAILICLAPLQAEAQKGWKTYTVEGEFSFKYPTSWDLKERENRFTSRDASLEYEKGDTSARIIFEFDPDPGPIDTNVDDQILSDLENITQYIFEGSSPFESGVNKYNINNQTAPYAIVTYSRENLFGYKHDYVAMIIAIKIHHDILFGRYVSNEGDFDRLLVDAEKIFESVAPVNSTNA